MQRTMPMSAAQGLRPKVLILGSEDVHARIDLMRGLADEFAVAAAGSNPQLANIFNQAGFRYFAYPLARGLGPCSDVVAFASLWRLMRSFRPDIVHAFDTKPGVYGCLAAKLAGVPVVVGTVTGLGSLYGEDGLRARIVRGIYEKLQRFASQHSDLTVFQNRDDRAEFVARRVVPAGKAALIAGSGVPTEILDPARVTDSQRRQLRESLGIPAEALLVTMVSRVIRSKGVEEFAAAAQQVRQRLPGTQFLLVGPADKDSVDSFSAEELAEFGRVVQWPGARRDIPQVLAASDLFVLPSYLREGIPRVLLEAAAMGLPLITTDSPGCNDVVEDGVNGCLVPARDPAALSRAIGDLLNQPEVRQRFGRASPANVRSTGSTCRWSSSRRENIIGSCSHAKTPCRGIAAWPRQSWHCRQFTVHQDVRSFASTRSEDCGAGGGRRSPQPLKAAPGRRSRWQRALVVAGPLILLGALAVKLTSRGPAFYRAKRAGLGGKPFLMFKLRTMRIGSDSADRKVTADEDDRVTLVGRWLRKFKIDELPQFWNVLKGDMAIVGPRPEDWDIVEQHYTAEQRRSLDVRPGIASTMEVDWYPDLTYHDPAPPGVSIQEHYLERHLPVQAAEGVRYVERQSLLLDVQVIAVDLLCPGSFVAAAAETHFVGVNEAHWSPACTL